MANPVAKSTSIVVAQRNENEEVIGFLDEDGRPLNLGGGGGSGVQSVTATAPMVNTGTGLNPVLDIPTATTSAEGLMSAAMVTALNTATSNIATNTSAIATKAAADPAPAAITASRALTAADNGGTLYNTTANAYTLTVPSGLPAGFGVAVVQKSTGAVTVAAGSGATLTSADSFTKTGGANKVISVINSGVANDYILSGQGAA